MTFKARTCFSLQCRGLALMVSFLTLVQASCTANDGYKNNSEVEAVTGVSRASGADTLETNNAVVADSSRGVDETSEAMEGVESDSGVRSDDLESPTAVSGRSNVDSRPGDATNGGMLAAEEEPLIEPEPAFFPCPTDGTACRIMPLGDSITDGIDLTIGYSSNGGYRLELFRQATLDGHSISFVGTRPPNGPATDDVTNQPFPRDHEGISGNTVAQVANRVGVALAANPPHIVLLQIGTNDLYQGMPGDLPEDLASLVDQITSQAPDALVVVAQITPLGGSFPNNGVPQYNSAIPGLVDTNVDLGNHVVMVDMFSPIADQPDFVTQLLPDNIHPNAAGYAIMGETWYGAIEAFLP